MEHRFFVFIIALELLLHPGITYGIETGIIKGQNARQNDVDGIIRGLRFAGREAIEITFPDEVNPENIEMAKRNYRRGIELYDSMRFLESENHLKKAVQLFYRALAYPEARQNLENALFYLGAIHVLSEKSREAEQDFLSLLQLNENFRPDFLKFSPKITKSFTRIKKNTTSAPLYEVYICSAYPEVIIDGSIHLNPPRRINLKRGWHTIVHESAGYFSTINLTGNITIYAEKINHNEPSAELASRIGMACGFKEIIYVDKSGDDVVVKNYNLDNPTNFITTSPRDRTEELKKPFYKKWWFWTGIGFIAGGSVGLYLLIENSGDKNSSSSSVVVKW